MKNGFGYTPLAEARAVENPKMEPVIKVLEKFKMDQDKIKDESDENMIVEAKLTAMTQRILVLESTLASIANLGKDLKANMKKSKDPMSVLNRFADKLSTIDMGMDWSLVISASQSNAGGSHVNTPTSAAAGGSGSGPSSEEQKRRGFRVIRAALSSGPTSPKNAHG